MSTAEIHVVEWAAFLKTFIKKRRFEAIILGWGLGVDPDQYEIWHSSKTGPEDLNHISYRTPRWTSCSRRGARTFDQEEPQGYLPPLQDILAEDQPLIFLYFRGRPARGVVPGARRSSPAPAGIIYNFIEWYVPKHRCNGTRAGPSACLSRSGGSC